jgi:hypothetical protein
LTTQDPPKFPPKTNNFQKPVKFVSEKGEKPGEKPEPKGFGRTKWWQGPKCYVGTPLGIEA